jgi:hypothetical protein
VVPRAELEVNVRIREVQPYMQCGTQTGE